MSNIAIIPARGNSKRIPRKNIKPFLGKPIIAYSIQTALASNLFDEVMVSTDDLEIAEVSKNLGAQVPFLRSIKNSDDYSTAIDTMLEVLFAYQEIGRKFENFVCLFPTAPFVTVEKLKMAYNVLKQERFDSVLAVGAFSYPIQRALALDGAKLDFIWKENVNRRSQDLPVSYHDAGQFYWMKTKVFFEKGTVFTDNSGAIVLSDLEVQDIDTESDWKIAEVKYQLINKNIELGKSKI